MRRCPTNSLNLRLLNVGNVKTLDHSMLLHPLAQRKSVALAGRWLKDIETSIQNHLPTGVCRYVSRVGRSTPVKNPSERDSCAGTGFRNTVQTFTLLLNISIVWSGNEVH